MVQRAIDVLVDDLHAAVAPMDHEYLWVLAVDPPFQGRGLSRVLVERLLATLEHGTRRPCYLETMDPRNVAIYQKFGFEVAGTRASKELELTITGMLCKP